MTSLTLPSLTHAAKSLRFPLISINPTLSSNPLNGFPPPPSRSISPAHCAHETGCRGFELRTSPAQLRKMESRVSIWMSSGTTVEVADRRWCECSWAE